MKRQMLKMFLHLKHKHKSCEFDYFKYFKMLNSSWQSDLRSLSLWEGSEKVLLCCKRQNTKLETLQHSGNELMFDFFLTSKAFYSKLDLNGTQFFPLAHSRNSAWGQESEPQQGSTEKLSFLQKKSQKSRTKTDSNCCWTNPCTQTKKPFTQSLLMSQSQGHCHFPGMMPAGPRTWIDEDSSYFPHNSLVCNSWWWWDASWQRMLEMTRGIRQQ